MDDGRNVVFSCGSTYCACLIGCVIRTLRRSVLKMIPKLSHTEESVLCKILGNIRAVVMKLLRVSLAKSSSVIH